MEQIKIDRISKEAFETNQRIVSGFMLQISPIKKRMGKERRFFPVHIDIIYRDGRLSISGVEGALKSGNCLGSCGQIVDQLLDGRAGVDYVMQDGYTVGMLKKLISVGREWHLNDLHAGCEHQRALGWEADGYDKHPSEPCPTCGYKFGTAWNRVDVPDDVLDWLKSLPVASEPCAWGGAR